MQNSLLRLLFEKQFIQNSLFYAKQLSTISFLKTTYLKKLILCKIVYYDHFSIQLILCKTT